MDDPLHWQNSSARNYANGLIEFTTEWYLAGAPRQSLAFVRSQAGAWERGNAGSRSEMMRCTSHDRYLSRMPRVVLVYLVVVVSSDLGYGQEPATLVFSDTDSVWDVAISPNG